MVSLQASLGLSSRFDGAGNLSKKRKFENEGSELREDILKDKKITSTSTAAEKMTDYVELHLDTPLPSEWQRCLDIKSGKIHFYNTMTQKKTYEDPRRSPENPSYHRRSLPPVSLDLELNLASPAAAATNNEEHHKSDDEFINNKNKRRNNLMIEKKPSLQTWTSPEVAGGAADEQEMVAAVCMRCHMLVMMCKAAPSCPNCKFAPPPPPPASSTGGARSGASMVKSEFRLLCCKD